MPGVLEVVAGVRLVGQHGEQVRRPDRQVGVEVDAAAPPAVVPVVAAPGLVADERDDQVLAVGEAEERRRRDAGSPAGGRRRRRRTRSTGIVKPSSQAAIRAGERPVPGQQRLELRRGGVEDRLGRAGGLVVEAGADVLEVGQAVAGQRARLRLEGDELGVEPAAPVGLVHLGGEARAERGGVVDEAGRRARAAPASTRCLQVGRAEVAVDERRRSAGRGGARGGGSRGRPGRDGDVARSRRRPGCGGRSSLHLLRPGRARPVVGGVVAGRLVAGLPDRAASSSASGGTSKRARPGDVRRPRAPARRRRAPARRRRRPSPRGTASPAAPPRRGSSAARPSSGGRPRGRRPPPRRRSSAGPARSPSACRPRARRGGSDPCSPTPPPGCRRRAGARAAARPSRVARRPGARPRR